MGFERHRERTPDRTQFAGECQLSGEFVGLHQSARNLPGRRKDSQRDRQVETTGFLAQISRREIDGDSARRELKLRILNSSAHAVAAFFDLCLRKTDQIESRQSAR